MSKTLKLFMVISLVATGAIFFALCASNPSSIVALSPNGSLQAKALYPDPLYTLFMRNPKVQLEVTNLASGKRVVIGSYTASGILGGGQSPSRIVWKTNGKGFIYIYSQELNEKSWMLFDVNPTSLNVHQSSDVDWAKSYL